MGTPSGGLWALPRVASRRGADGPVLIGSIGYFGRLLSRGVGVAITTAGPLCIAGGVSRGRRTARASRRRSRAEMRREMRERCWRRAASGCFSRRSIRVSGNLKFCPPRSFSTFWARPLVPRACLVVRLPTFRCAVLLPWNTVLSWKPSSPPHCIVSHLRIANTTTAQRVRICIKSICSILVQRGSLFQVAD